MENVKIDNVEARRSFLKKVAYVAPAVVVLGSLTLPSSASASTFVGSVQSVPATNPATIYGTSTVTGDSGPGVIQSGTYQKTGSTTVSTFTAEQVKSNDFGLFTWAKQYFSSIFA